MNTDICYQQLKVSLQELMAALRVKKKKVGGLLINVKMC